jgi:hypothetical protein
MASSIHPFVKVMLDKERHLCYGAAAFIEFKEMTGTDLLKYMRELSEKFSALQETQEFPLKEFRDILWAGLIHEDPALTPREVSNMFSLLSLTDLIPLVMEAFTLGMPKAETDENRPHLAPTKARKSIGA